MPDLEQLESRIERDRAQLGASLETLTNTVAPDRVAQQVTAAVEGYGGELGRQAWSAARSNPAAFALVGAGIGLLLTGSGTRPARPPIARTDRPASIPPEQAFVGFDDRVAHADAELKMEMTGMTETAPEASRLRAALDQGLDTLPASARRRVVKARKAALAAQEKVEAQAARVARRSSTVMNEQPLAVGAVALGIGAVVAALLPSTRRENELLGARRDALMAEARSVLQEEMDKLHGAASARLADATEAGAAQARPH